MNKLETNNLKTDHQKFSKFISNHRSKTYQVQTGSFKINRLNIYMQTIKVLFAVHYTEKETSKNH